MMAHVAKVTPLSPANARAKERRFTSGPAIVLYLAVAEFVAQMLTAARYGIFRDELYYAACGEHLAWGYVDHPPLTPFIAWLERHVGGDSLYSLRFLPAVAAALTVWLAGTMARRLGGGRFAQAMASLAVLVAGGYLLFFHLLTDNFLEPLLWTTAACIVMRLIQTGHQKLWLWFGVVTGVGMLNKWSMAVVGIGVVVGLVFTRERKALRQPWIWLGGAIALLIWLPNIVWNVQHHWPFFELMRNVRSSGRDVVQPPLRFMLDQAIFMTPVTVPLWLAGMWWYFFGRDNKNDARGRYRMLGWTWLTVFAFFMAMGSKSYYVWPIYGMLFAAGGVALEQGWTSARLRWLRPAYAVLVVAGGAFLAPMALPVLPPYTFIAYTKKFHLMPPAVEHQRMGPMGQQVFADMFGWEDVARETARAYYSLPPDIREKTVITASNFGDAGAIDFFGPKYGLPKAVSGHQNYWYWGPRNYTGESALMLAESPRRIRELCQNPQVVGHVGHPLARGDEHYDIYWCHPMKWNLQEVWPKAKHWN